VAFYIETYGQVLPQADPEVARVHRVFERVRAVADKNSKRRPQLVVVNSEGDPWAIALPDGHVVLSRQAVAVCHHGASMEEAEARLAFVLGHELAHLAHDDFLHQEVHNFLAAEPSTRELARFLQTTQQQAKDKELEADDTGFIYAALAGYPVDVLLQRRSQNAHFFDFWMQQTQTRAVSSHAAPEARAALLRRRLDDLRDKVRFYDFGVRLSHFDQCDDAIYFFQAFQKTFPGREVHNNLGYCYLQQALQEMDPEKAYFYWMPLLLDSETRAEPMVLRGGPALKSLEQGADGARGFLEEAVAYLRQAVQADPNYGPARLNLAVAYLYLGQPHQARAVLAEARTLAPEDALLQGLEAVILYEQSDVELDLWPTAVARLEKLAARPDAPNPALFNLARLLAVRPRPAEARVYWNRLAERASSLPTPIRAIVCREQSALSDEACHQDPARPRRPPPWKWPVTVDGVDQDARALSAGGEWQAIEFDWLKDKLHGRIYERRDGTAEMLALDQFVQMQVLTGQRLGKKEDLSSYCPRPLRQRALVQGTLWSCQRWAALERDGVIHEVWWVAE
jgi:tetratricopeptide (TPR) repeat protein